VTTKKEQKDDARLQQQIMIVAYVRGWAGGTLYQPAQTTSGNYSGRSEVCQAAGGALRGSDVDNSISLVVALTVPLRG
jgi:hypothetical protein